MKLADFKGLIANMPYMEHSIDIKKENQTNKELTNYLFKDKELLTLSRKDLYEASESSIDLRDFVYKTILWGFSTGGRGDNIKKLLEVKNLNNLLETLQTYKNSKISSKTLENDIKRINGARLATFSKFTHFLGTTIDGKKAVILDSQIIETINSNRFQDFDNIDKITYNNALKNYENYLNVINNTAQNLKVKPDQVEMFLFMFGRNLSL